MLSFYNRLPKLFFTITTLFLTFSIASQTLPAARSVNWKIAGLRDTSTIGFTEVDMASQGIISDGITPNDLVLTNVLSNSNGQGMILKFPAGSFLFEETINLPSNTVIKGDGAESTHFIMDLGGTGHSIEISGSLGADTTLIKQAAQKNNTFLIVHDVSQFVIFDWIKIIQFDEDLVTSSWANNTVGQICKIVGINDDTLFIDSPLRLSYPLSRNPFVRKIHPVRNSGVECLSIERIDDTAPQQSCNVSFNYAVNSWVHGISSDYCTFSHVETRNSSNISIKHSFFQRGFDYGGGGRAYGVMLQATSNECLIADNIFSTLRHSMIVQSGANGNVFAYNYSTDPFWDSQPNDAAGDLVLHGNYPYANLFEQNIGRNIVIDNSHGPNGPYNTFLRNRADGYGIFFSATNSPNQNFLGNEITNNSFPYNLVNYTILGSGHFLHGNNNKGTIDPSGSSALPDESYAFDIPPYFVQNNHWAGIGTPHQPSSNTIRATERHNDSLFFSGICGNTANLDSDAVHEQTKVYPNPTRTHLHVQAIKNAKKLTLTNALGQIIYETEPSTNKLLIETVHWKPGLYFLKIQMSDDTMVTRKILK
jgi:hypothetical protein